MQPQHAIEPPRSAGGYPGRDVDCIAALRPSVADLATAPDEALPAIFAGGSPPEFVELVRRAEEAGWEPAEADAAIRQLVREQEGARGTIFD